MKMGSNKIQTIIVSILAAGAVFVSSGGLEAAVNEASNLRAINESPTSAGLMTRRGDSPSAPDVRTAEPAWLGVVGSTLRPEMAQAMNLPESQPGVLIHFIESDSPADVSGLQGSYEYISTGEHRWLVGGDIITAMDDRSISSMPELHELLGQAEPGQMVTLTILRAGKILNISTTLAEFPFPEMVTPLDGLQFT